MKIFFKKVGKVVLYFLGVIILFIAGILLIIRINSNERPEPVTDRVGNSLPNSVAIIKDTIINGAMQRLTIRGHDKSNPVLLRVHGGPGQPHAPQVFRYMGVDLEDLFTVCYWDQRGAGPADFKEKTPDHLITKEAIVKDGLLISEFLRKHFNEDKIYVEGASWGTAISALMVKEKPQYFSAYIGQGQVGNNPQSEVLSYQFAMDQSINRNDTIAIKELQRIGAPPYKTIEQGNEAVQVQRRIVSRYMPNNTDYKMRDILKLIFLYDGWSFNYKFNYFQSGGYGPAAPLLWPQAVKINLQNEVPEIKIPVFIIQGDSDHFTETSIAKEYFDSLKAPYKKMKIFENTGHVVFFERQEGYRKFYKSEVLKMSYTAHH